MDPVVAALYRRYRPETFAEMIGQSQVTEPLMTALRTGRIGHAYLFSGPRGCGKTTSARILARCLNCAEGPTDTPCGTCPSCVELSRDGGGSLDVVEIDAASHGGVDDARDLRERAVFAPARDRYKIFIIDEAHMVTAAGFNALLKIVEEPPPHVKFVFATTEPDKVIGTIRSRTHHYPFRLIAPGTLIDYVQSLCDSEGVQVEPGVLPLVVRAGGGSPRDTLSILDQLIAGSEGDRVSAERAAGLLGFTHAELLDDAVAAFGAHDPAAAFRATDRVVQTGQDPRRFVEDLLERLRDLIVVSATTVDGAAAVFRGVPQDQLTRMFEQAQSFGPGELSRIADVVSGALDKMAGATAPRLQLELMVARALVQSAAAGPAVAPGGVAAGAAAGAAPSRQVPPASPAETAARPPAQQAPRPDPLAALAAARNAVQEPQAASAAQAQAPAQPQAQAPAATQAAGEPAPQAPNAAETAASIRSFLREDAAGAGPQQSPAAPQPERAPQAQPQPAGGAESPEGAADRHPNEAAASFGRPISDVLSAADIASIGAEPSAQPRPAPAAPGTAGPAPSESASSPEASQPAEQAPAGEPAQGSEAGSDSSPAIPSDPVGVSEQAGDPAAHDEEAPGGFDDLVELWPELLEEILQQDRDAWNAVRVVTPLALEGDVLTVGLASQSDLAAFKSVGAGPLRDTIHAAVGVSVKYVPKRVAAREGAAPGEGSGGQQRAPQADAEEPHRAGAAEAPAVDMDDPVQRAAARLSALGPALAAPGWAGPVPAEPAPSAAPDDSGPEAASPDRTAADRPNAADGQPADPETAGARAALSGQTQSADAAGSAIPTAPSTGPAGGTGEAADASGPRGAGAGGADSSGGDPYDDGAYPDGAYGDGPYGDTDPYDDPYAGGDPYADANGPEAPAPDPSSSSAPEPAPASSAAAAISSVPSAAGLDPERTSPGAPTAESPAENPAPETPAIGSPAAGQPGEAAQAKRTAPAFTRYGEAVVREVLGARFVEERPLPTRQ
ncbi:DNA polymerase III subunit gamma and tau [Leucobacter sp.]